MESFMKLLFVLSLLTLNTIANDIVLVHGANFNGNSWSKLANEIKADSKLLINLPGRDGKNHKKITLDSSTSYLCVNLDGKKEYTFVVHSQGGAIINNLISKCKVKVKSIFYISAVMPVNSEKVFSKLNKSDEKNYFKGITYNPNSESMVINNIDSFLKSFDMDAYKYKKEIVDSIVNEPALIGISKVHTTKIRIDKIKKFYVYTKNDNIISYESQMKITKAFKFQETIILDSAHLPMITKVKELSSFINKNI